MDKEEKKENGSNVSVIKNLEELLKPEVRFEKIMKSIMFTNKILVQGDGQLVTVARVVLPEYKNKEKLKRGDNELGMSTHRFKIGEGQYLTVIVFICLQE